MSPYRTALLAAVLVLGIAGCGSDENPEGFDGSIDCGEPAWSLTLDYERDHEGERTPFDAMVEWSGVYEDRGHRIHVESSRTGTVVIDGSEVAFMRVLELPTETFEVVEAEGCSGFEPPSGNG